MAQPDYVRHLHALALRCWPAHRLPWSWLALSALGAAVNKWLAIWPPIGSATVLQVVRLVTAAVALLSLVEFGRRSLRMAGRPSPGPWIHVPLLLVILGWIATAAWSGGATTAVSLESKPAQVVQVADPQKLTDLGYSPDDRLRTGVPVVLAIFAGCACFIALCALANRLLSHSASNRPAPRRIAATADRSHGSRPARPGGECDTLA